MTAAAKPQVKDAATVLLRIYLSQESPGCNQKNCSLFSSGQEFAYQVLDIADGVIIVRVKRGRAHSLCPPVFCRNSLEVEPEYELNDAATRIIRRRNVAVSFSRLPETSSREIGNIRDFITRGTHLEVLIIDRVQEFSSELDVCILGETESLDNTHIKSQEPRAVDDQVSKAALTGKCLYATATASGRDEPARGHTLRRKAVSTCWLRMEGPACVQNSIVREELKT